MQGIKSIAPQAIEEESFRIIKAEFCEQTEIEPESIDDRVFQVLSRVIHATGDFSFARSLNFHPESITKAIKSIRAGRNIYCDVSMGASGVSKTLLQRFGGEVLCHINDVGVSQAAKDAGKTRTETALNKIIGGNIGIISVGNAPTALIAAMQLIDDGLIHPDLVVGVPVGFVNAAESKALLMTKQYPYITNSGRKGGTPVAVAIVNALLRLSIEN